MWSYTRHPNFFGDATVWFGIWLIAAEQWPGVLAFGTGKRLLENSMSQRDGWDWYAARTSGFVPLPHWVQRRLHG